jgi:xanthine dehydrogenase accessory factor
MFDEFLAKARELWFTDAPFALAIVVNYEPPVSAKPGDKALIQSDGRVWGWIGGGCVQPLIVREALKAIEEKNPRIVRIAPSTEPGDEAGVVNYSMSCHGGGALVVYVEPVLPKSRILIFGRSLVAQSLAKLGKATGYAVAVVAPEASRGQFPEADFIGTESGRARIENTCANYVVVATQGERDEEALEDALRTRASYISFVASHAKSRKVIDLLAEKGMPGANLARIKAPAGLNIGTSSPEEIAVSILAEIIQAKHRFSEQVREPQIVEEMSSLQAATDPVCGMMVDVGESTFQSEYNGMLFYFCCAGCKQAFEREPERYVGLISESPSHV